MNKTITSFTRQVIVMVLVAFFSVVTALAQTPASNKGRDFYCSFIPNYHEGARSFVDSIRLQDSLFIFIASDIPTTGTITCTDRFGTINIYPFQIFDPTQIYSFALPWLGYELDGWNKHGVLATDINDTINQAGQIARQHFRIESNDDVTVYALNQATRTSDAFLVLPVNALGTEYFALCYPSDGFPKFSGLELDPISTPSEFSVTATEDNTQIIINPSDSTVRHGKALDTVILQRGESYLVQAQISLYNLRPDLTGSKIISNKPVAVFAGHQRALLPVEIRNTISSRDHLVEQMPPLSSWGKSAILTPYPQPSGITNVGTDLYRVLAAFDSTVVTIGGIKKKTLSAGQFFTDSLLVPAELTSTKPVLVSQYKKTSSDRISGNARTNSDPFMMIIPPKEQFMLSYRCVNAQARQLNGFLPPSSVYALQYIIVVAPETATSTVRLDGNFVGSAMFQPILGSKFMYATLQVGDGTHSIIASEPIGIYVFGYGFVNSYGYVGGMSFKEFDYQEPEIFTSFDCFQVRGVAIDTHRTDSRLARVTSPLNLQQNMNVAFDTFTPYADSVHFTAALADIYQDGECSIIAEDSIGFITTKKIAIPGFTLSADVQLPNGKLQDIVTDGPLNRSYCFPVKIKNYGSYFQTITNSIFSSSSGNFSITTPLPIVIAPNATKEITVCFYSDHFGIFHDTLSIGNKCINRKIVALAVRAIPDSAPPVIARVNSPCPEPIELKLSEALPSDLGIETITFIDSLTTNCTIETSISEGYQTLKMIIQPTNPDEDAFFSFIVVDSAGNMSRYSDTIPGFTLRISVNNNPSSRLDFGETIIGELNCREIEIENYGKFALDFGNPTLTQNTIFSIPPSRQSTLIIQPNQKTTLGFCYAPIRVENRIETDTMFFKFGCRTKMLLLEGRANPAIQTVPSRCNIPVRFVTVELPESYGNKSSYLGQNAPNPTVSSSSISFAFTEKTTATITLYDMMGKPLEILADGDFDYGMYEINVNLDRYPEGLYFYQLQTPKERTTRVITLTH
ncbi:MAG: T9SS type A sorting domain-containing protein [Bacteroidetes bacterium]|nr:T9SS type A sorting domain-containing protein [Bacteroidota bacterium]